MSKIVLKGCPRCRGDVEVPIDKRDDPSCIQCGFQANDNAMRRIIRQKSETIKLVVADATG